MGHKHVILWDSSKSYPTMRTCPLPDRNERDTCTSLKALIDKIMGLTPTTSRLTASSNTSHNRGWNHDRATSRN